MTSLFIKRSPDETMGCFHSCLNSVASAFKSTNSLRFQGEFCRYSEGFYSCFLGLSRSTNKLCGKHIRTKNSSHPCGCCEFACWRIICWCKKPCADTNKFFLWYHGKFARFCDFFRLVNRKSNLRSCLLCLNSAPSRRCEVCFETVSLF